MKDIEVVEFTVAREEGLTDALARACPDGYRLVSLVVKSRKFKATFLKRSNEKI